MIEPQKAGVNKLYVDASKAWNAFCKQDYLVLNDYGADVYNYFVHHPIDLLNLENPLLVGRVFQICLGFLGQEHTIQEVRAENAFLCYAYALSSENIEVHDEACARLMILLVRDRIYLRDKVSEACQDENFSFYNPFSVLGSRDFPPDMPISNETRILLTAYYIYTCIIDKNHVEQRLEISGERRYYIDAENHILGNCKQRPWTSKRMIELGEMVFVKIVERLKKDIKLCSGQIR